MIAIKPILYIKLWFWDIFNSISCRLLIATGCYNRLITNQTNYIKKLERHNEYAQNYIALAYIRAAKGHFHQGELIQTIDKCMMAIYTYGYNGSKAYRLCWNAYRILATNSPDFNRIVFWENEVNEEKELLRKYFDNNK